MLSVIVCTRNRVAALTRCLGALRRQSAEPNGVEVLVVDNGSSDGTSESCVSMQSSFPFTLRLINQSAPGLNLARNAGLDACSGKFVAFIDDDALALPRWAESVVSSLQVPGTVAIGGRILLAWPSGPPRWLGSDYYGLYSGFDLGSQAISLSPTNCPVGANMAFATGELRSLGGFSVGIGRIGKSLLSNDEIGVFHHLMQEGKLVRYEPRATVIHCIEAERAHIQWVTRRAFAQGASDALSSGSGMPAAAALVTDVAFALFRGKGALLRSARTNGLPGAAVTQLIQMAYVSGRARGHIQLGLN